MQMNSIYKSMSISVYTSEDYVKLIIGLVFQIKWIVSLSAWYMCYVNC